jgi:hypothetical protein
MMIGKVRGHVVAKTHDGDILKMKELSDRMGVEWEREHPAAPVVEKGDGGATDAKGKAKREQGAKAPADNG